MSESLSNSLTFLASALGIWVSFALLTEASRLFIYLRSIFKRKEEEKMIYDFIDALKKEDKPKDSQ
jgi:hypothetical protein